jgi:hypothetical protein
VIRGFIAELMIGKQAAEEHRKAMERIGENALKSKVN